MKKSINKILAAFAIIATLFAFSASAFAAQSLQALTQAANKGNVNAMYELAKKYDEQWDRLKAAQWYRKAADKGHAKSMAALGCMFIDGSLGNRDLDTAKKWGRKAVACGYVDGLYDLAVSFGRQSLYKKEAEDIYVLLEEAANKGSANAMFYLAAWSTGQKPGDSNTSSFPRDVKRGGLYTIDMYKRAIAKGSVEACMSLAETYENGVYGIGLKQNGKEALQWYKKATDMCKKAAEVRSEDIISSYQIASLYFEGENGVKKDLKEAKKWALIAQTKMKKYRGSEINSFHYPYLHSWIDSLLASIDKELAVEQLKK